jgi:hypothetical protein
MLKVVIGAACVATFLVMFWLTEGMVRSGGYRGPRVALALDFGVTLAVGYGLFVLADRYGFIGHAEEHRGLLRSAPDEKQTSASSSDTAALK